jgi:hypothetical protein
MLVTPARDLAVVIDLEDTHDVKPARLSFIVTQSIRSMTTCPADATLRISKRPSR